jgi:hypothetical protein
VRAAGRVSRACPMRGSARGDHRVSSRRDRERALRAGHGDDPHGSDPRRTRTVDQTKDRGRDRDAARESSRSSCSSRARTSRISCSCAG